MRLDASAAASRQKPFQGGLRHLLALVLLVGLVPVARAQSSAEGLLDAGERHTCVLLTTGKISCWGESQSPWEYEVAPPAIGTFTQLSPVNGRATCAFTSAGETQCRFGGTVWTRPPSSGQWLRLSQGPYNHSCGVTTTGAVECWGSNSQGQLYPPAPSGGAFVDVSVGNIHSCAIAISGVAQCWGRFLSQPITPPSPISGAFVRVSSGNSFACALTSTGIVQCWGDYMVQNAVQSLVDDAFVSVEAGWYHACAVSAKGQVRCWGDETHSREEVPAPVSGVFVSVSAASDHSCALTSTGAVQCWGWNGYGQSSVPASLGPIGRGVSGPQVVGLDAGLHHSCLLTTAGGIACMGRNSEGQSTVPTPTSGTFASVSAGLYHTCALTSTGTVQCWGDNGVGQTSAPTSGGFAHVSAGYTHTCARTTAGAIQCWGDSASGKTTPPAPFGGAFADVSAGYHHTCAAATGTVQCWGNNTFGQASAPAPLAGVFIRSTAGGNHSCALATVGVVQCWGDNTSGQTSVPALPSGETWASVSAGDMHTCGTTNLGGLRCWGANTDGQTDVPTLPSGQTWTAVSAGDRHTCGLSRGVMQCWGSNAYGQTDVSALPQPLVVSLALPGAPRPDLTVTFTPGAGTVPSISAYVRPGQTLPGTSAPVRRLWHISPTGGAPGWTARVRLTYLDAEVPEGADEATLRIGKTNDGGATWEELTPVNRNTAENWIEVDVTSFSTFAMVDAGGVLPVELVSFEVTTSGRTARLAWTTASETNNTGFVVERQSGNAWTDASPLIAGRGTTTERSDYSFAVTGLTAGRHTFRLRQIDTDGSVHYSPTASVEIGIEGEARVTLLGRRAVRIEANGAQAVLVEVYDVLGRTVSSARVVVSGTAEVALPGLASGAYVVRVAGERFAETRTLVVR